MKLVISDDGLGLVAAVSEVFAHTRWQRCIVHWYRNAFSKTPSTKVKEVALMLKAIHASEDRPAAAATATRICATLREMKLPVLVQWIEETVAETLTFYSFPSAHWRRVRTNNLLERIMREIRRRTRVVGAFPDGESALNLAAARLRQIASPQWSTRRYLGMSLLVDMASTQSSGGVA